MSTVGEPYDLANAGTEFWHVYNQAFSDVSSHVARVADRPETLRSGLGGNNAPQLPPPAGGLAARLPVTVQILNFLEGQYPISGGRFLRIHCSTDGRRHW